MYRRWGVLKWKGNLDWVYFRPLLLRLVEHALYWGGISCLVRVDIRESVFLCRFRSIMAFSLSWSPLSAHDGVSMIHKIINHMEALTESCCVLRDKMNLNFAQSILMAVREVINLAIQQFSTSLQS
jgi:hypothetical protein